MYTGTVTAGMYSHVHFVYFPLLCEISRGKYKKFGYFTLFVGRRKNFNMHMQRHPNFRITGANMIFYRWFSP